MHKPFQFLLTVFAAAMLHSEAQELKTISLPKPEQQGGKPLMEALLQRRTSREFAPDPLSPQELSNLLWAGFGINRPENDHRTAPSAMNSQEIQIYVALQEALYVYEAKANELKPLLKGDFRARTSGQDYVKTAPVVLVYVADLAKLTKAGSDIRPFYAGFDAGCICQNVYLYCASAGLATVVYDLNRPPLATAMRLRPEQQVIMAQSVGHPKTAAPEKK